MADLLERQPRHRDDLVRRSRDLGDRAPDGSHGDASESPVAHLQRSLGNRAVAGMLGGSDPAGALSRVGAPGPVPYRGHLEQAFGTDFSDVSVRFGARRELAQIGANAAAYGRTVVFADTRPDRETVAHELAHVVQNRRAGGGPARGLSDPEAPAETEADSVAEHAARGEPVSVASAPAGGVQRSLLDVLKRNLGMKAKAPKTLTDEDVLRSSDGSKQQRSLGSGSANVVDRVQYGGFGTGYFKPNMEAPDGEELTKAERQATTMSSRAVASSRLAQALGMGGTIAEETYATHDGKTGSTSREVTGSAPLKTDTYNREIGPDEVAQLSGAEKKMKDDKWYAHTGSLQSNVDFTAPGVQRGMFDLQAFDALVGQSDRHGGNIYVGQGGSVTGIDNDRMLSAGQGLGLDRKRDQANPKPWRNLPAYMDDISKPSTSVGSRYQGLPSMIDRETADKIAGFDFTRKNLRRLLDNPDLPEEHRLTDEDFNELKLRGRAMQQHIQSLEESGGIIDSGGWGTDTYWKARSEITPGSQGDVAKTRNYLVANERLQAKQRWGGLAPTQGPRAEDGPDPGKVLGSHREAFRDNQRRERAQRRKGIDLSELKDMERAQRWQRRKGIVPEELAAL